MYVTTTANLLAHQLGLTQDLVETRPFSELMAKIRSDYPKSESAYLANGLKVALGLDGIEYHIPQPDQGSLKIKCLDSKCLKVEVLIRGFLLEEDFCLKITWDLTKPIGQWLTISPEIISDDFDSELRAYQTIKNLQLLLSSGLRPLATVMGRSRNDQIKQACRLLEIEPIPV